MSPIVCVSCTHCSDQSSKPLLRRNYNDQYKSAVVLGNDLTANGDFDSNGFTARGWNHDACSSALSASRDVYVPTFSPYASWQFPSLLPLASLGIMEAFLEDISSAKKKESEGILNATSKMKEFQQRLVASSYSKQRLGPLLNAGTNLAIALESVEEYYTDVAEYSAEQCTSECSFVFYFLLAYLTWSPFV